MIPHKSIVKKMSLRFNFQDRLSEIRTEVLRMGSATDDMLRLAIEATIAGDTELSSACIRMDDAIDQLERDTLMKTVATVMQETPVASDLRMLVATLGVIGEIEKVADDAVKLCKRSNKLQFRFPFEMKVALHEMGEMARHSFNSALRLYADYDAGLAAEVIRLDDEVDSAYSKARNRVLELIRRQPDDTKHLVRTIEAFHALEHVSDHAVEIAKRLKMLYPSESASHSGDN